MITNSSCINKGVQITLFLSHFLFFIFSSHASIKIEIVSDNLSTPEVSKKDDIGYHIFNKIKQNVLNEIEMSFKQSRREWEWLLLQRNDNVCLYNKIVTAERQQSSKYSKYPIIAFPSNRLILHKKDVFPEVVSLKEIIHDAKLQIGYVEGRSYGEVIDRQIEKYKAQMIAISGNFSTDRLREIFSDNKIDGLIGYTLSFKKDLDHTKPSVQISTHQILNTKPFIYGYIACSDSDIGKKAIKFFDEAILKKGVQEYIIAEHLRVFPSVEGKRLIEHLNSKW